MNLSPEDRELFKSAWDTARANHGHKFTFYLPGMIRYGQIRGRYPAISLTGNRCDLKCEHCKGKLLEPMLKAEGPVHLIEISRRLAGNGAHGILLTGGSDLQGRLPWERYSRAIEKIGRETGLFMSAHTGFPDLASCRLLKKAGVKQGLIDIMGDEQTATRVYHLAGLKQVLDALAGIKKSGLQLIPHIVAGLWYGKLSAEYKALEIIRDYRPDALVIVVLTPLKGTPMAGVTPPSPLEIGRLIARARLLMPDVPISLGCERPRDRQGWQMEKLAIRAGTTRMAVWSEEAIREAEDLGLIPRFQPTCCSLSFIKDFSSSGP
ncbi:MAG: radical SAM protein [Deltaproteobacteria bacterium]|nr:radical SAM protein [Deltaproteobacteria bacterium]MBW2342632.1 radical SAM protein [Deltaproteobacteria bacterium]